ncbi:hypothetical protein IU468_26655 [Nocardia farcinica]|uniref:hypothetical protein n=1 Tax=Nocardia farcinica TaxID=37329 RepID=UPI00189594DB|nr:hypothetical protein [Nocardia farcinica]MBF6259863.1 hypothetical protein [Nocardia farcinica]
MSGDSPSGLAEAFKRACVSILLGVVAIYFAVALIHSMWPTLVVVLGVIGLIAMVVGGIVIYRKIRAEW